MTDSVADASLEEPEIEESKEEQKEKPNNENLLGAGDAAVSQDKSSNPVTEQKLKKFPCRLCKTDFSTSQLLIDHNQEKHPNGEGYDFPCQICPMAYKYSKGLARHVKACHESSESYSCSKCSCSFPTEKGLAMHVSREHKEETNKPSADESSTEPEQPYPKQMWMNVADPSNPCAPSVIAVDKVDSVLVKYGDSGSVSWNEVQHLFPEDEDSGTDRRKVSDKKSKKKPGPLSKTAMKQLLEDDSGDESSEDLLNKDIKTEPIEMDEENASQFFAEKPVKRGRGRPSKSGFTPKTTPKPGSTKNTPKPTPKTEKSLSKVVPSFISPTGRPQRERKMPKSFEDYVNPTGKVIAEANRDSPKLTEGSVKKRKRPPSPDSDEVTDYDDSSDDLDEDLYGEDLKPASQPKLITQTKKPLNIRKPTALHVSLKQSPANARPLKKRKIPTPDSEDSDDMSESEMNSSFDQDTQSPNKSPKPKVFKTSSVSKSTLPNKIKMMADSTSQQEEKESPEKSKEDLNNTAEGKLLTTDSKSSKIGVDSNSSKSQKLVTNLLKNATPVSKPKGTPLASLVKPHLRALASKATVIPKSATVTPKMSTTSKASLKDGNSENGDKSFPRSPKRSQVRDVVYQTASSSGCSEAKQVILAKQLSDAVARGLAHQAQHGVWQEAYTSFVGDKEPEQDGTKVVTGLDVNAVTTSGEAITGALSADANYISSANIVPNEEGIADGADAVMQSNGFVEETAPGLVIEEPKPDQVVGMDSTISSTPIEGAAEPTTLDQITEQAVNSITDTEQMDTNTSLEAASVGGGGQQLSAAASLLASTQGGPPPPELTKTEDSPPIVTSMLQPPVQKPKAKTIIVERRATETIVTVPPDCNLKVEDILRQADLLKPGGPTKIIVKKASTSGTPNPNRPRVTKRITMNSKGETVSTSVTQGPISASPRPRAPGTRGRGRGASTYMTQPRAPYATGGGATNKYLISSTGGTTSILPHGRGSSIQYGSGQRLVQPSSQPRGRGARQTQYTAAQPMQPATRGRGRPALAATYGQQRGIPAGTSLLNRTAQSQQQQQGAVGADSPAMQLLQNLEKGFSGGGGETTIVATPEDQLLLQQLEQQGMVTVSDGNVHIQPQGAAAAQQSLLNQAQQQPQQQTDESTAAAQQQQQESAPAATTAAAADAGTQVISVTCTTQVGDKLETVETLLVPVEDTPYYMKYNAETGSVTDVTLYVFQQDDSGLQLVPVDGDMAIQAAAGADGAATAAGTQPGATDADQTQTAPAAESETQQTMMVPELQGSADDAQQSAQSTGLPSTSEESVQQMEQQAAALYQTGDTENVSPMETDDGTGLVTQSTTDGEAGIQLAPTHTNNTDILQQQADATDMQQGQSAAVLAEGGLVQLPDGAVVSADSVVTTESGEILSSDGQIVSSPAAVFAPDSTMVSTDAGDSAAQVSASDAAAVSSQVSSESGAAIMSVDGSVMSASGVIGDSLSSDMVDVSGAAQPDSSDGVVSAPVSQSDMVSAGADDGVATTQQNLAVESSGEGVITAEGMITSDGVLPTGQAAVIASGEGGVMTEGGEVVAGAVAAAGITYQLQGEDGVAYQMEGADLAALEGATFIQNPDGTLSAISAQEGENGEFVVLGQT